MEKLCRKCGVLSPLTQFHTCKTCKDGHRRVCRTCVNAAIRPKRTNGIKKQRVVLRHYLLEYWESHPCIDCGESDPRCLTFDHIDSSTKHENISTLVSKGCAMSTLQAEITKCNVRCSNCHAKKTSDQSGFYTSNPEYRGDSFIPTFLPDPITASDRGYSRERIPRPFKHP